MQAGLRGNYEIGLMARTSLAATAAATVAINAYAGVGWSDVSQSADYAMLNGPHMESPFQATFTSPDAGTPTYESVVEEAHVARPWAPEFGKSLATRELPDSQIIPRTVRAIKKVDDQGTVTGVEILGVASGEGKVRGNNPGLGVRDPDNVHLARTTALRAARQVRPWAQAQDGRQLTVSPSWFEQDGPQLRRAVENVAKQEHRTSVDLVQTFNRHPDELSPQARLFLSRALRREIVVRVRGVKKEPVPPSHTLSFVPLPIPRVRRRKAVQQRAEDRATEPVPPSKPPFTLEQKYPFGRRIEDEYVLPARAQILLSDHIVEQQLDSQPEPRPEAKAPSAKDADAAAPPILDWRTAVQRALGTIPPYWPHGTENIFPLRVQYRMRQIKQMPNPPRHPDDIPE